VSFELRRGLLGLGACSWLWVSEAQAVEPASLPTGHASAAPSGTAGSSPGLENSLRAAGKPCISARDPVPKYVEPRPETASMDLGLALAGKALEAYLAAKVLYKDGDYRGSLIKLRASYAASGDPRLLWNMAACYKQLREYAAVEALLNTYLSAGERWLTDSDKAQAQNLLGVIAEFVSSVSLRVLPAGAEVWLDEEKVEWADLLRPLRLDMGEHVLRVALSGFEQQSTRLDVPGGGNLEVKIELQPVAQSSVALISASSGSVYVDEVNYGKQFSGALTLGKHDVRIEAPGFATIQRRLPVSNRQRSLLAVRFESERRAPAPIHLAEANGTPAWIWLLGGTLVASIASGLVIWEVGQ
jgi:hypothetical protein